MQVTRSSFQVLVCLAIAYTAPSGIVCLTEYISSTQVTCTIHRYTDLRPAGRDLGVIGVQPRRVGGEDCTSRYVTCRVELAFMYN